MGRKTKVSSKIKEGCILRDEVEPEYGFLKQNKNIWNLISHRWNISVTFNYFEDDPLLVTNIFCHSLLSRRRKYP